MAPRLELQSILTELLGSKQVYFQPPPTVQMAYPCIVYRRDYELSRFADDTPYKHDKRYLVTVIDRNPDSGIPDKIAENCRNAFSIDFILPMTLIMMFSNFSSRRNSNDQTCLGPSR